MRKDTTTNRGELAKQFVSVLLGDDLNKTSQIGSHMAPKLKEKLISFLRTNIDVFAWIVANRPGIFADIITHKLNIDPYYYPVK